MGQRLKPWTPEGPKRSGVGYPSGTTRKNFALPDTVTVAGLALPTVDQVSPAASEGLDCRVPSDGVQRITILSPETEAESLAC
jgi:hypothetical protein